MFGCEDEFDSVDGMCGSIPAAAHWRKVVMTENELGRFWPP